MGKQKTMRIIAGEWGSRILKHPEGKQTRPMPDRVREAIFGILGSIFNCPGQLPPVTIADVFAGSGSMGLEALSRGAKNGFFLEKHPVALRCLKANIESLDSDERAKTLSVNVWRDCLGSIPEDQTISIIFLDPPYRDSQDSGETGQVCRWLSSIIDSGRIAESGICVLHYEHRIEYAPTIGAGHWHRIEHRQYGTNKVSFYQYANQGAS